MKRTRYVVGLVLAAAMAAWALAQQGAEAQQLCRQQCYTWCDTNAPNSAVCEAACRARPSCSKTERPASASCLARCYGYQQNSSKAACLKYCKRG